MATLTLFHPVRKTDPLYKHTCLVFTHAPAEAQLIYACFDSHIRQLGGLAYTPGFLIAALVMTIPDERNKDAYCTLSQWYGAAHVSDIASHVQC